MNASVWQVHRSWVLPTMLVLVLTALAEVAIVWVLAQPARWVALIAGTLPVTLYFFVALPLIRKEGAKPS